MSSYLNDNEMVATEQHGFVLGKSVVTDLLQTVEFISSSFEKGWVAIAVQNTLRKPSTKYVNQT